MKSKAFTRACRYVCNGVEGRRHLKVARARLARRVARQALHMGKDIPAQAMYLSGERDAS